MGHQLAMALRSPSALILALALALLVEPMWSRDIGQAQILLVKWMDAQATYLSMPASHALRWQSSS